jgi:hypothetical protein
MAAELSFVSEKNSPAGSDDVRRCSSFCPSHRPLRPPYDVSWLRRTYDSASTITLSPSVNVTCWDLSGFKCTP